MQQLYRRARYGLRSVGLNDDFIAMPAVCLCLIMFGPDMDSTFVRRDDESQLQTSTVWACAILWRLAHFGLVHSISSSGASANLCLLCRSFQLLVKEMGAFGCRNINLCFGGILWKVSPLPASVFGILCCGPIVGKSVWRLAEFVRLDSCGAGVLPQFRSIRCRMGIFYLACAVVRVYGLHIHFFPGPGFFSN